ncbi:TonB family protein [candidate division KSB1 bacterium]|nr:TonB family protein [candidate division KSB1 bacterium]
MNTVINSIADFWLRYFSYAVVQNTILLSLILIALYVLRNERAHIKHALSIIGVIKLLVPPFLPASFAGAKTPIASVMINPDISILPAQQIAPRLSYISIFFLTWCMMLLFYLASAAAATVRLRWSVRNASFLKKLTIDAHTFHLYLSPNISVPLSIGIRPQRIYVPESWLTFESVQQNSLLRHEIAHIQRWDGFYHILQIIAQALYLFHPLVWLLNARINEFREMACDDLAIERSHINPLTYSRYLVHVAENLLPKWSYSSASALIKQRNKLYHRVNYQMKESTKMKPVSKRKVGFIGTVLCILILPLSWYCQNNESPKEPTSAAVEQQNEATVGKIWGQVVDATSGEPLPGANVLLMGTTKGGATDMEGRYYIVNVPPGIYRLQCSFIGYASALFQDVKVAVNQSTQIDFKLQTASISAEEISVTASKSDGSEEDKSIFIAYDEPPTPIGGWEAVSQNLVYPEPARKAGVQGRVMVGVHIDAQGDVIATKIEKSLGDNGCDEAAVAAIEKVKWSPAKQRGKPVAVWVTIPVEFKLQ